MKILSLAVAAMVIGAAQADECSPEQVTALKTSTAYKTLQVTDCSDGSLTNCKEFACMKSAAAVIEIMPNCTIDGVALKQGFETQLARMQGVCNTVVQTKSTARQPEKNGCTAEQVFLAENAKYAIVLHPSCDSPRGTDDLVAAHKLCGKACLDAYAAVIPVKSNCTIDGVNIQGTFADGYADVQNKCHLLAEGEAKIAQHKPITLAPVPVSAAASASPVIAIAVTTAAAVIQL